ncbi:hypothetical protein Golob_019411 [Gossypium lobatum]|uniref:RNase H type-1 domain-containing protein n=1 Tax=Gossypium lobatum TaxID=34289 RepID=A0A7J8L7B1_9ROSI|nr:hypothetical protein [Gossypium lobatum]
MLRVSEQTWEFPDGRLNTPTELDCNQLGAPTPADTLKFKVDGAVKFAVERDRCGSVLSNDKGSIFALFSYPLQVIDSNLAELLAIKTALEVFTKTDWFHKVNLAEFVSHIEELLTTDATTVFPVSGSSIDARITISVNPLLGVMSNSLMFQGSFQPAALVIREMASETGILYRTLLP